MELPCHMVFARLSDLSTPDMAATSWQERHVVVDVCFDETRASTVKVGARPTAVRNRAPDSTDFPRLDTEHSGPRL